MKHYMRTRRPLRSDPRSILGHEGQRRVAELLRACGRTVIEQDYHAPFDLLVDGLRFEVKTGKRKAPPYNGWHLNVQSNGILNERSDYYVFRLEDVPQIGTVHLLLKSPLGVRSVRISERTLVRRYTRAALDFEAFATGNAVQRVA